MPTVPSTSQSRGYDYFMVRTRRGMTPTLVGLAERLGTGEKQAFESGAELLRLLERWSGVSGNMPTSPDLGNPPPAPTESGSTGSPLTPR